MLVSAAGTLAEGLKYVVLPALSVPAPSRMPKAALLSLLKLLPPSAETRTVPARLRVRQQWPALLGGCFAPARCPYPDRHPSCGSQQYIYMAYLSEHLSSYHMLCRYPSVLRFRMLLYFKVSASADLYAMSKNQD